MDINYQTLIFKINNKIFEEMKNVNYNDFEDLVYSFQLTYGEIMLVVIYYNSILQTCKKCNILHLNYIPTKRTGFFLTAYIYEITDINLMLRHLFHNKVKKSDTINELLLKSNLNINQNLILLRGPFFYTELGFVQSQFGPSDDIEGFIQLKPLS